MIDIHTHILPGIDDGAKNLDESFDLARAASDEGITDVIATPHHYDGRFSNIAQDVRDRVQSLNEKLQKEQIQLTVHPGQEIHVHKELLLGIERGTLTTLASTSYLLLEMPPANIPSYLEELIYELKLQGKQVIIAHPERNAEVAKQPERLAELIEAGAYAQMTTHSLLGGFGRGVERTAWSLCRQGLIHYVSSDAHHLDRRGFRMREAYLRIESELGREWSDYYQANARGLLRDIRPGEQPELLAAPAPNGWSKLKSWLGRA
ncbi:tyrosine-protein phosphatase [Paenibacillus sp. GCM10023252]|uniref:tyrosine-protein phosphatase n=1 Tax=Paenibacillus sp. GCM10023252 TaxID=3252649 RepID=UPI003606509C